MKKFVFCLALASLCAAPCFAQTDSDTMQVTATVLASCDVEAPDLAFGSYNPVSTSPLDASVSVSLICTNGANYDLSVGAGLGVGATIGARLMTSGLNTLAYALYRDASHTQLWGVTAGSNTLTGTGSGTTQSHTIYGRVPALQTAPAGSYTDTVTVTVSY